jgi:hypothetical protein
MERSEIGDSGSFLFRTILVRKRTLSETVNDPLKHIGQLEHTRHRSLTHCLVHGLTALLASTSQEKKPSWHFTDKEERLCPLWSSNSTSVELTLL